MRLTERGATSRGQHDVLFGASAADGLRIAIGRPDQSLLLEPAQRAVDGAKRDVPARALGERLPHRYTVGVVTEAGECEKDELLEFPEVVRHWGLYTAQCTINQRSRSFTELEANRRAPAVS
jgi:hypothetical protein